MIQALGAMLVIVILLGWQVTRLYERSAVAEGQLKDAAALIATQGESLKDYEGRLAARELSRQRAEQSATAWRRRWERDKTNQTVQEWAATPLPAAVRDRLREITSAPGGDPADGGPPEATDPASSMR